MKKYLFCMSVVLVLSGLSFAQSSRDWIIIPGVRVGSITETSTEGDLIKTYGARKVVSSAIAVGEGATVPGTVLFPGEPEKTVSILWKSTMTRSNPDAIIIGGPMTVETVWKTVDGITLGMSLRNLEKINGGPFELAGFGWDYSGTIYSSKNGKLKDIDKNLVVRVSPGSKWQEDPEYASVIGEKSYMSDHPVMQKMNPTVYSLQISFR